MKRDRIDVTVSSFPVLSAEQRLCFLRALRTQILLFLFVSSPVLFASVRAGDAEIESLPEEKQVQFQEMRCASAAGRGSMYDSVVGEAQTWCCGPSKSCLCSFLHEHRPAFSQYSSAFQRYRGTEVCEL